MTTTQHISTLPPKVLAALQSIAGESGVLWHADELVVFECDALPIPRARPMAVVFPTTTQQAAEIVQLLAAHGIAILPRGSGTGLCGGIVSVTPSVQVSTARMRTIHQIDLRNRWALVDAGVANLALSNAMKDSALHYAPDPSSQPVSTIGGNAATNAGGIHTLKHGVTVNHILGLEIVLSDGSIHVLGGPHGHVDGPDLVGLLCGTEGTLGLITRVWCRLMPKPTAFRTALATFSSAQDACLTVCDIIASGIIPASMEMMDGAMIRVAEEAFHFGFPTSAEALLLLEVDGIEIGLDADLAGIEAIARKNKAADFQSSADPQRRAELWFARKNAFGAVGRISPNYCTQDACVPRSRLPEVIDHIAGICGKYNLRISNVFHAGDGNLHPAIMYDQRKPGELESMLAASGEILRYCISIGGSVTGEHGVGIEKLPYMRDMFSAVDLDAMHRIRRALVPDDAMNPYKVLPRDGVTIDLVHPQRKVPEDFQ